MNFNQGSHSNSSKKVSIFEGFEGMNYENWGCFWGSGFQNWGRFEATSNQNWGFLRVFLKSILKLRPLFLKIEGFWGSFKKQYLLSNIIKQEFYILIHIILTFYKSLKLKCAFYFNESIGLYTILNNIRFDLG